MLLIDNYCRVVLLLMAGFNSAYRHYNMVHEGECVIRPKQAFCQSVNIKSVVCQDSVRVPMKQVL